ncbi:MAG: alpha/beta hydrolase [Phycisphaerales bacterium]|nr:alpha/beta hydrolase [Phycisphaerales bacterium]
MPENRAVPGSRLISIKYVRLAATGDRAGPPIVYLAGGPGGSGIEAINYRYRMFMAMRKHGDVIALDQRGTGDSNIVPECQSRQTVPATTATTDRRFVEYHREALRECLAFWRREGVDLAGYNTLQNAQDLDALRGHLGAKKLVLWGTSYGSHLALAALKEMSGGIDRVVISSVEGLNQTLKLPARADQYLDRLQSAINTQPDAKAAYPDIKALMRRVHAKLEREPVPVNLKSRDGAKTGYLLQRRDMQLLAAGLIADPRSAMRLLGIYDAIDRGADPALDRIPARLLPDHLVSSAKPIMLQGMPVAMDIASGTTSDHRRKVSNQAKTAILGHYLDPIYFFDGMAAELDLGNAFRAGPVSEVPVLVLSGTLDGRTHIESQREAVSGLKNATMITIENAGHNLFDEPSPAIQETIDLFMGGSTVRDGAIKIELPDMAPKQPSGVELRRCRRAGKHSLW